jgi:uncharacterized protein (DUF342 family)
VRLYRNDEIIIMNNQDNTDPDDLLARLEKQLDEIDTAEILQDMTTESLKEKGFIGDKPVEIPRRFAKQDTEKEHLVFEDGVDFERLADPTLIEDVGVESLLHLGDVEKGRLIATRDADESVPVVKGINVVRKENDNKELYYASVRGKVVIIKNALHVIASDRDCTLSIRIDSEKMNAFLDCGPGLGQGRSLSAGAVREALNGQGIKFGIDENRIAEIIGDSENSKKGQKDACIASGKPQVAGADGVIEYLFSTDSQGADFKILADGRIDYHHSQNIAMAKKDQMLARLIAPKQGLAGMNVLGEEIPAAGGTPAALTAGEGVRSENNTTEFYAEINGSIILNGSVIEVVNTYVVDGDVDYSTGNIQFNGNVLINGNVPDGFEVKAEGDIIVAKIVESARLEAGRDIVVKGGVQGKGKGLISAGRDIKIGYAQNARLEAQGNIYIGNSAINSSVFTSKSLIMLEKRGSVIGGEVFAQRGIDVRILGSENGVKTSVEVGTNYLVMRRISELDIAIEFCEKNILKIDDCLKTFYSRMKSGQPLTDSTKQVITKTLVKKQDLEQRRTVMFAKRTDLFEQSRERDVCFVKVKQTCFPDVMIKIKEYKTAVSKARENVRFFEDRKAEAVAVGAY